MSVGHERGQFKRPIIYYIGNEAAEFSPGFRFNIEIT